MARDVQFTDEFLLKLLSRSS